ncbi:MAG: hypothetical protein M3Z36_10080 [Acidobacteriota bacterium]|nr:hypothetical protein [Acidobacteriota bacterium]
MHKLSAQSLIALTLVTNLSFLSAATPSIGVALADGNFTVDKARTPGNAPLFDGNTIETSKAASRLQLNNGVRVLLASDSRSKVYHDRMVLEKGTTQVDSAGHYDVSANFLRVTGSDQNSARITMNGTTVQVASLKGTLQVSNAQGVALARIAPGLAFDFTPQDPNAGASADTDTNKKKKKKKAAGAMDTSGNTGSPGMAPMHGMGGGGLSQGTAIIAGIVVAAAVGTTVGVLATSGASSPSQGVSPSRP